MKDTNMRWSLVLMSVFGVAVASPINLNAFGEALLNGDVASRNSAIEEQLMDLLEDLRQTMLTGSDDVPVLDPFVLDTLTIDEDIVDVPGLNVLVEDTVVTKLSTFIIEQLTVQRTTLLPLRYRITIDGFIPVIETNTGHYELSAVVEGLTFFGKGNAKLYIIEPRITATMVIRPTIGIGSIRIRLEQCQIKFSLKGFEPRITGFLGDDPSIDEFINTFLSYFIPDLVTVFEDDITEALSSAVLEVGNEILSDLNLFDILG